MRSLRLRPFEAFLVVALFAWAWFLPQGEPVPGPNESEGYQLVSVVFGACGIVPDPQSLLRAAPGAAADGLASAAEALHGAGRVLAQRLGEIGARIDRSVRAAARTLEIPWPGAGASAFDSEGASGVGQRCSAPVPAGAAEAASA